MTEGNKDKLSRFWFIIFNAIPPIGFFLYFKHRRQYANKAKSALTSALIGVPIGILSAYIMNTYILN